MYKLTCSLINSWNYMMEADDVVPAMESFMNYLGRGPSETTRAMQAGLDFERWVQEFADSSNIDYEGKTPETVAAVRNFARRVRDGMPQVASSKRMAIDGEDIKLVGIADWVGAGIITDIKRVQRYEYGKYQCSAQHPMYMELFPEALRFDYLIFDGHYCYLEQYRRGDFRPIYDIAREFLRYLKDTDLFQIYKTHWEV